MATPKLRRTRIVCISDTHNCTVKLPAGDVLIHAGDLTNQGSYSELSRTVKWLEEADFEAKIVVAGNHDITLDEDFYFHHGESFHNQNPQSPADCLALLTSSLSLTYLCHDSANIRLTSPSGPHTEFTVFGSPYSPRHGLWAFYYDAPDDPDDVLNLTSLWELIPLDADIVVTHTPPRTHRDAGAAAAAAADQRPSGCEALRQALWRVRPRLAVCGHIHYGRGAERVLWDLERRDMRYAERSVTEWEDAEAGNDNRKMSLVDLTGKNNKKQQQPALANDGSHPGRRLPLPCNDDDDDDDNGGGDDQLSANTTSPPPTDAAPLLSVSQHADRLGSSVGAQGDGGGCGTVMGFGGDPGSGGWCDGEALAGRLGRRETCVVNAAIMKSKYPHVGGKQLNKPIVVDLNLPVWEEEDG